MKKTLKQISTLALILGTFAAVENANADDCDAPYKCAPERVTGVDNRPLPPVYQPPGQSTELPCGDYASSDVTYRVRINAVECGEGAVGKGRGPLAVSKEVMDAWDTMSRSGNPLAQEKMQEMRQAEIQWTADVEFPMWESWSYDKIEGGYNSAQCGDEPWRTTCERTREESYQVTERVEDRDNCLEWEEDPEPVTSSSSGNAFGGSSSSNSGSSDSTYKGSTYNNNSLDSKSGSDSYKKSVNDHADEVFDRAPDSESAPSRNPARSCVRYGKKNVTVTKWKTASTLHYSCTKRRASYCTWPVRTTMTRSCPNHVAKVAVNYMKDPNWKPVYTDGKNKERDYHNFLPNKFDLLPGESEMVYAYANLGRGSALRPNAVIESTWNDYRVTATPASSACYFGMKPNIKLDIATIGRKIGKEKAKAPNLLATPVDLQGNSVDPYENESKPLAKKPGTMMLQDKSRAMMLQASMMSRTFPRPEKAVDRDEKAIHKVLMSDDVSPELAMGFWAQAHFKVQLFRKVGPRMFKMTPASTYDINGVEVFDDYMTFHFEDGYNGKTFYNGTGPLQSLFGPVWKVFGAQLSPNSNYIVRVQSLQQGLPFYQSGCKDGSDTCGSDQVDDKAFSKAQDIPFKTDKTVKRGFVRWYRDLLHYMGN